jgi:HAE1 family hydrophobic/amphiphilic exporter-1
VTLNVMSLGGLALGVGMLVDTSIVVLESITRCREEGDSLADAAIRGVREVSSAVIASTLTTVAVFLPIVFVEGVAGQLFRDQALAVVFSLLASLGVALFFLPMLASRGSEHREPEHRGGAPWPQGKEPKRSRILGALSRGSSSGLVHALRFGKLVIGLLIWPFALLFRLLGQLFETVYSPIERVYRPFLANALRLRWLVVLLVLGLGSLAGWRFGSLGSEVVPQVHEGQFEALIFFARDIDVETTDRLARPLEREIARISGVGATFLTCGVAQDELKSSEEGPSSARVHITLARSENPRILEDRVRRDVRELLESPSRRAGLSLREPDALQRAHAGLGRSALPRPRQTARLIADGDAQARPAARAPRRALHDEPRQYRGGRALRPREARPSSGSTSARPLVGSARWSRARFRRASPNARRRSTCACASIPRS